MNKKYDVIIIGAGSAGLMTARTLGNLKRKVLLIDKKTDLLQLPFKTLGSFIDIKEFDLSEKIIASKIIKTTINSKRFKCSNNVSALIIDKKILHQELVNSIDKQFVDIKTSTCIKDFEQNPKGKILNIIDDRGNQYFASYFIDCSGTAGVLSKQVSLQEQATTIAAGIEYNVKYLGDPNEVHFFIGKDFQGGYGWIFPIKNQRAIIGFGSFDNEIIKQLKKRIDHMLDMPSVSKIVEKDNINTEGGIIPITNVINKFIYQNLVCVGDSVSQVNPVVGEGYRYIFKSAIMAAQAINEVLEHKDVEHLSKYEKSWNKQFFYNYKICKKLQKLLGRISKSDLLIDLGVIFINSKRDHTLEKIYSGEFSKRELFLP